MAMSILDEKFAAILDSPESIQCFRCKHLVKWPYCLAFLSGSGIPEEIRENTFDHVLPFPGDHGIRFLEKDSPYELSESSLREVIAQYQGTVIMPELGNRKLEVAENRYQTESLAPDLIHACKIGDVETVKQLLAERVNVNQRDEQGNTPLMHACRNCHPEIVKLLLKSGCDVHVTDKYSKKAIHIALDWGYPTIVKLLEVYEEPGHLDFR
ncbi:ankyrin repeat domain-containing protein [Desulfomonile tiedjei]|uniref:Ankyrin repeat-containing protein n=1 Tax=Desulfomonile tiedjei (strain ATCC 49306 / DSM 6799 / DCB-1) TaxID=706587 RepID=I4C0R7_DESTA|nr:ankyrin repeat domain-containing protein [Desulfomonile tiedjei]AFM23158.1 ankyrin repeat-containing protein [Desulfomonile tiedjei DSM 6799]